MESTTTSLAAELPELATRPQVAAYTQVSVPTLARWAMENEGPPFIKLGRSVRYRRADVIEWLAARGA